ncbi:CDP-alcohol phosphatidyltransferase [Caldalkalibacillus thermarum TA2.A1]|uniref:CDP-alcohol phosphatidyltransferase n=1 Tax=Caldalkalibacillus thermarum (strain TA2.A1) TaxID=986075 RepID=F5L985_CALTT|nr:CDP-alcohol phosphatidyltransferase family protein [Caldalkalibacillus thermarum]EGL82027.1 CDP-alcohol phosphatidyltransferase [Caldalkalibacillus thermarum TA2.A1]QZT34053.1 CDP-alcohol phosphatidyltransferase family protein [Caldalkalibacillus thermarum TA2.A1]
MEREKQLFTMEDMKQTYKKKDAWWTVILVDPIASRIALLVANFTNITPNQLSITSFIIGLAAAFSFYIGSVTALIAGALLYHLSFIIDCMDGKIARLKKNGSMFGMVLDISLDHIRVVLCALALTFGQFNHTGDIIYLYLAALLIVVYFIRHINALHIYKIRREMKKKLNKMKRKINKLIKEQIEQELDKVGIESTSTQPFTMDHLPNSGEEALKNEKLKAHVLPKKTKFDLQSRFKSKFQWYLSIRDLLLKYRIRAHLFSGIEFQMFIFIVAPLLGMITEIIILSCILLLLFEIPIVYKLWLSTKDYERQMKTLQEKLNELQNELQEMELSQV